MRRGRGLRKAESRKPSRRATAVRRVGASADGDLETLYEVFDKPTLESLAKCGPSAELSLRLQMLAPQPSGMQSEEERIAAECFKANREAWNDYLREAKKAGLFTSDLLARLRAPDPNNFRSAISECLAAWFFSTRLASPVRPGSPSGRGCPDLAVSLLDGEADCEVKAPYRAKPRRLSFFQLNDDHAALEAAVDEANKQLSPGRNVVFLVPSLRVPVQPDHLEHVFIGRPVFYVPVGLDPRMRQEDLPPPSWGYATDRKLTKGWGTEGPRFTRTSILLCVEEFYTGLSPAIKVTHRCHVVHNPYAGKEISRESFGVYPQFVKVEEPDKWSWVASELEGGPYTGSG